MRTEELGRFLASFAVGMASGAVVALLFTPYGGAENKRRASRAVGERTTALQHTWEAWAMLPADWKDMFAELKNRFTAAVDAAREETARAREECAAKVRKNG